MCILQNEKIYSKISKKKRYQINIDLNINFKDKTIFINKHTLQRAKLRFKIMNNTRKISTNFRKLLYLNLHLEIIVKCLTDYYKVYAQYNR